MIENPLFNENAYHTFKKTGSDSLTFFCVWYKDNKRLFYPYQNLNFFALSRTEERLLLIVAGEYILVKGKHLKKGMGLLQKKTLDYIREASPEKAEEIKEGEPIITEIVNVSGEKRSEFNLTDFLDG